MKHRRNRNRWTLIAIVAIALGTALVSLPSLAPLAFSNVAKQSVAANGAPPVGASWQVAMMGNRW